ncbi:MAG: hypothetical protein HQK55_05615, partial [Deltaproteobacteria bacterium]|nr:hypothetical protein [Deltaproteobacteria bacterium]
MTDLLPQPRSWRLALIILMFEFCLSGCAVKYEPLLGFDYWRTRDGRLEGKKLSASMTEVDDLGDIWVVNAVTLKKGRFAPVLRAEWHNLDGQVEGELTRVLEDGTTYVIFTLFIRVYK